MPVSMKIASKNACKNKKKIVSSENITCHIKVIGCLTITFLVAFFTAKLFICEQIFLRIVKILNYACMYCLFCVSTGCSKKLNSYFDNLVGMK